MRTSAQAGNNTPAKSSSESAQRSAATHSAATHSAATHSAATHSAATVAEAQAHPLLHLQGTIGNQAVQRLLRASDDTPSGAGHEADLAELRSSVSRVTGTDVSDVPVRTGDAGPRRAMTHEGRVTLGAQATRHDVAHELAHAAQQRTTSGTWLGRGEAERRADSVADAALNGGSATVASGRVPGAAILGAGDPYSREGLTLTAPPAGASAKDLQDLLKAKVAAGDITAFSVSGVTAGDPEEIYLYNALLLLADKRRWGSELDLITAIGAGQGEVTVRFDAAGKADAQLVGKSAPVVAQAFAKPKDAIDELVKKYKLAKVAGEKGKTWSIAELNKVIAAWARLSGTEAAALEGFSLIRTDKLFMGTEEVQGETTHTDSVDPGTVTATHLREIRFADSAFSDDSRSFIGDAKDAAPASFEVLIHEVGHALEAKPFDDLNRIAVDDTAKVNKATADAHTAQLAANKAFNAANKKKYPAKDTAPAQPYVNAVLAALKAVQAFEGTPDATNETAAKTAITDRDTAKAKVAAGNAVVSGFGAAVTAQDNYMTAVQAILTTSATAAASKAKADALKTGSNTTRLQLFVDFVNKEKIPRPTAYAEKHWPAEPAEFFDEAFSLWKNDPVFFGKYSAKLKAWFDAGNHLK